MKIAVFDTHRYDRQALDAANAAHGHELSYFEGRLTSESAALANGYPAVCAFVNDRLDDKALTLLQAGGTRLIALRSAGFNHVDLAAAERLGLTVVRVPAYSPHAVAEHAVALLLCLNRQLHRAYARVREGNFSLEGLTGFNLHGKTVGVLGTGQIGQVFARIMRGFGCEVVAYDPLPDTAFAESLGVRYVSAEALWPACDIISLHMPLTPETTHLIDAARIAAMKRGVVVINTSRGGLVDTQALIDGLKRGQVGGAALDVYEREAGIFFNDGSAEVMQDDCLARLLTFPNVLVTGHQAFLTDTALANIAETTLGNVSDFQAGKPSANAVTSALAAPPRV